MPDFPALRPLLPVFLSYVLSFIYVGIYWNNHHHMFHTSTLSAAAFCGRIFICCSGSRSFLSRQHGWARITLAPAPAAVYGVVLLMAAIAYYILQCAIIAHQGPDSLLASAVARDWKGKLSPVICLSAIPLAYR